MFRIAVYPGFYVHQWDIQLKNLSPFLFVSNPCLMPSRPIFRHTHHYHKDSLITGTRTFPAVTHFMGLSLCSSKLQSFLSGCAYLSPTVNAMPFSGPATLSFGQMSSSILLAHSLRFSVVSPARDCGTS
jgi:hypothetical protein